MKVFVTGVAGQLGHDVVNEICRRGYTAVGSDIATEYAGVQDGSAVTKCRYVALDITDKTAAPIRYFSEDEFPIYRFNMQ